jgi:hypothetical protein
LTDHSVHKGEHKPPNYAISIGQLPEVLSSHKLATDVFTQVVEAGDQAQVATTSGE